MLHIIRRGADGALQVFTVEGVVVLVEGDLVAQHHAQDHTDQHQVGAEQQRKQGEQQAHVEDAGFAAGDLETGAIAFVQQLHKGGFCDRLAVDGCGEALLILGHFNAFLDAAVALQIHHRTGDVAVVVIQQCDCFLVGDAALAADHFNIFDCKGCHGNFPFQLVWFLLTLSSYHTWKDVA